VPAAEIGETGKVEQFMDPKQFEVLSRRVGTAATRRGALKVLAGGMAASAFALLRPGRGAAEEITLPEVLPITHCKVTLQKCHNDLICCSGHCKKNLTAEVKTPSGDTLPPIDLEGVCDCRPRGATCYTLLEGAFCCSGRCTNEAKCA
jgi:hypothetical protein